MMNRPFFLKWGISFLLVLPFIAEGHAKTYYVNIASSAAKDSNQGTSETAPFKTINHAAKMAQPGDTVIMMPGVYRESVNPPNSGTKEKPIIFRASEPGKVTMSGGEILKNWKRESGDKPIYSTKWTHDFFFNVRTPGSRLWNGKMTQDARKAPNILSAEYFLCNDKMLRHCLNRDKLQEGYFHVDWDRDLLYVWLPEGIDPNQAVVEGGVHQTLFGIKHGNKAGIEFIRIEGIHFRCAPGFLATGAVYLGSNWHLENCTIEKVGSSGIQLGGDNIGIENCTVREVGYVGIFGYRKSGVTIRNCVVQGANQKGYHTGYGSGGIKLVGVENILLDRVTSSDNVGPGIWLDGPTIKNYDIRNCITFGNYGLVSDSVAAGIFVEISPGPGKITNNISYSNAGSGIKIAESSNLIVKDNVLVDNGNNIFLRDVEHRGGDRRIRNVEIRNNVIKDWRKVAIQAGNTEWGSGIAAKIKLTIDGNIYDPPSQGDWVGWGKVNYGSFKDYQRATAQDSSSAIKKVDFDRQLVSADTLNSRREHMSKLRTQEAGMSEMVQAEIPKVETIEQALDPNAGIRTGSQTIIPVYGRGKISAAPEGWKCTVYDLKAVNFDLIMPNESSKKIIETNVPEYPDDAAFLVQVKLTKVESGVLEGEMIQAVEKTNNTNKPKKSKAGKKNRKAAKG